MYHFTYNFLLLSTSHNELSTLSTLQSNLLLLNSLVEVRSESQMGDRHIIKLDVVLLSTLLQKLTNTLRDLFSLSQKLLSVVLGNHSLHDLVTQRGKHTITVIRTHLTMNKRKILLVRMSQHSKRNTNGLQIFSTRFSRNFTGSSTNVVHEGVLQISTANVFPTWMKGILK